MFGVHVFHMLSTRFDPISIRSKRVFPKDCPSDWTPDLDTSGALPDQVVHGLYPWSTRGCIWCSRYGVLLLVVALRALEIRDFMC